MRKSILGLTVGLLSLAASAQAQILTLPEGTTGVTPIEGTVKAVEQVRVANGVETRVTLDFTLQTCADTLMPLISHSEVQGNRTTIYVTALSARNKRTVKCSAAPQPSAQVSVPGSFGRERIRVIFMGQRSE
jgi:hypothetical protein